MSSAGSPSVHPARRFVHAHAGRFLALTALLLACSSDDDSPSALDQAGSGGAPVGNAGGASAGGPAAGNGATAGGAAGAPGAAATPGEGLAGSLGLSGAAGAGAGEAVPPGVRFVGRVDASVPEAVRFAWSGVGILARFSGTGLGVRLDGGQQYTVLIDGELGPKLTSSGGVDNLATGLTPGEHSVEIYRRTEANQGESTFRGFTIEGGELLAPPPASERRIEIIGDSISCGYGNEGADMSCSFSPDTENHYLTYGAIAARNVGAELSTVAWSGKGVVCNYGDDASSCVDPMPLYFDRALPARSDGVWDFSQFQPQAVVINLGTNDFSTMVDPGEPEFVAAYVALLERVRTAYPDALILCTVGPLLGGTDLTTARAQIASAVQQRTAAGDASVQVFELAPTNPADGYGCDYHPSLRTHEIMAETLTSVLTSELGW